MERPTYSVRRIELREADLRTRLLPRLLERVFHVTTQEAWPSIAASGFVCVQPPDDIPSWSNAYFRSVGHVSLCDLRFLAEADLELALDAFSCVDPRPSSSGPVFLFLRKGPLGRIVTHADARDSANNLGKQITPHIETGYPGNFPLTAISDVLVVDVKERYNHPSSGSSRTGKDQGRP